MKEYIERDEALRALGQFKRGFRHNEERCAVDGCITEIMKVYPADVVERKRGHWIDGADQFGAKRGEYRVCSFCNACFPRDDRIVPPSMWQCCPNCFTYMGADIRRNER